MNRVDNNQATYRRLKSAIDRDYPKGHLVAIDDGRVVADAADFDLLDERLRQLGYGPRQVLVAEAGGYHPEHAVIFL